MRIFGNEMKRDELMKRIGDISQIVGVKYYEFLDGMRRGVRAVDIDCPSGLSMTVLIDRGLDLSHVTYKSVPINWKSPAGEASAVYYESTGNGWNNTFFGGLLTTCGLMNVGDPCIDNGEELGLHGRISNIAAQDICLEGAWENNDYYVNIKGIVKETSFYGHKLQLTRRISVCSSVPKIIIEDTIENIGYETSPVMLLYHVNVGFPILDEGSELIGNILETHPYDEESQSGLNNFREFSGPVHSYREQNFWHDIEADRSGYANIAIVNRKFQNGQGLGLWLKYRKDNLPYLIQWKQLGEGEYLCGIEPSNCLALGRKAEREQGTLKFIDPGEKLDYKVEMVVLTSNDEINNCCGLISGNNQH